MKKQWLYGCGMWVLYMNMVHTMHEPLWLTANLTPTRSLPSDLTILAYLASNTYWSALQKKQIAEKNALMRAIASWDGNWEKKRLYLAAAIAVGADPNTAISNTRKQGITSRSCEPMLAYTQDCLLSLAIRYDDRELYQYLLVHGSTRVPDNEELLPPLAESIAQIASNPQGDGSIFLEDILSNGADPNAPIQVTWFGSNTYMRPLFFAKTRNAAELLVLYGAQTQHNVRAGNCLFTLPHVYALCDEHEPALLEWCAEQEIPLRSEEGYGKTPMRILIDKLESRPAERTRYLCGCIRETMPQTECIAHKIAILASRGCLRESDKQNLNQVLNKKTGYVLSKHAVETRERAKTLGFAGLCCGMLGGLQKCVVSDAAAPVGILGYETLLLEAGLASALCLAGAVELANQWEWRCYPELQRVLCAGVSMNSEVPMQYHAVYMPGAGCAAANLRGALDEASGNTLEGQHEEPDTMTAYDHAEG